VDRPELTTPTSSPACALGPADSGHHRRRAAPRCDREDLPKPTPPFTGPSSPPVSHAALFSFRGYCSKGGRDLGEEQIEARGFLNYQRLRGIVAQGYKLKEWFRKHPGTSVQTGFPGNLLNISNLNTNRACKIHNFSFIQPNLVKPILPDSK
jgi:hypothetical protein